MRSWQSPLLLVRALAFLLLLALPAAAEIPAAARAMLLLGRGDLEAARALLVTAPDTAETELARGALAEAEGDFAAAAGHYRGAARELPAEAAHRLGTLALREGRPADARRRFEFALKSQPDHALARYGLALALEAEGKAAEALVQADRVLALDPAPAYGLVRNLTHGRFDTLELAPVNLVRAQALILQGRLRHALGQAGASASWQAASDLAPAELLEPLLNLARSEEDPGVAALWLQAFLESSVEPTGVEADLAVWGPGAVRVYLPGGRVEEVRSLRLGVDPDGRVIRVGGGTLGIRLPEGAHGMTVDRDGTVRAWQQDRRHMVGRLPLVGADVEVLAGFRERDPGAAEGWALARALGEDTERLLRMLPFLPARSQVTLLAPLTETPLAPLARARLGALYFGQFQASRRLEDLAEARRQWTELRRLEPDLQFPLLNLATASLVDGDFEEARTLLGEAVPERSLPVRLEIQLAMAQGQWDRASEAALRYRTRFPHDPYPRYAQAEILAAQDRKTEALAAVDELIALNPALAEARYLRVRLLGRLGDLKRQRAELEALLEIDPSPYRAQRLLGTLLDRTGETARALELYRLYLASPEALVYETEDWVGTEVRVREMTSGGR